MATEDDRFDERTDDVRDELPNRDAVIARARAKVNTPATIMIVVSVLLFILSAVFIYLIFFSGMDLSVEFMKSMENMVPDPKEKAKLQQQIEEAKNRDKSVENVINVATSVLALVGNLVVLVAGLRMKALKSYGLCIAGSIVALIPYVTSCCCLGLIPGIWSLVVLSNGDVKAGFDAMKRQSAF